MTKQVDPMEIRFCPICGEPLIRKMVGELPYCPNSACASFGTQINLVMEQLEVKVTADEDSNGALTVNDRKIDHFLDCFENDKEARRELNKVIDQQSNIILAESKRIRAMVSFFHSSPSLNATTKAVFTEELIKASDCLVAYMARLGVIKENIREWERLEK